MKWCCVGFKAGYDAAGERGQSILIGRDSLGDPDIVLQFRAVDAGKEDQLKVGVADVNIAVVVDVRIVFCPWCGRNAVKWYGKSVDGLYRPGLRATE